MVKYKLKHIELFLIKFDRMIFAHAWKTTISDLIRTKALPQVNFSFLNHAYSVVKKNTMDTPSSLSMDSLMMELPWKIHSFMHLLIGSCDHFNSVINLYGLYFRELFVFLNFIIDWELHLKPRFSKTCALNHSHIAWTKAQFNGEGVSNKNTVILWFR